MNLLNVLLTGQSDGGKILIAPRGEFPHQRGLQILDQTALARIAGSLKNIGRDVVVDFNHDSFSNPKAIAAGWVKTDTVELRNDGVYAVIDWVGTTAADIEQKRYRYLSPVFSFNAAKSENGRLYVDRLINMGITNNPNIADMPALANQQFPKLFKEKKTMKDFLTKLKNTLGLADDADESAVLNSAVELRKKEKTALGGDDAEKLKARVAVFNAAFPDLTAQEGSALENSLTLALKPAGHTDAEVTQLKNRLVALEQKEITTLVNSAVMSGKLLPAQKAWALKYALQDRAGFESYLGNQLSAPISGELGTGETASAQGALTPEDAAICNQLGLDKVEFLKNKKEEMGVN